MKVQFWVKNPHICQQPYDVVTGRFQLLICPSRRLFISCFPNSHSIKHLSNVRIGFFNNMGKHFATGYVHSQYIAKPLVATIKANTRSKCSNPLVMSARLTSLLDLYCFPWSSNHTVYLGPLLSKCHPGGRSFSATLNLVP